ncbi:Major Facilitator Superfamily protein [Actinacidiphila yanglinensis]|uniref:Major Facilitator Superfamily protein n=2 Tax=Actinacidiphila yanglinensis TaxID=310779 RepID=A0A1H6DN07_9ACTN|nr:Major Facilitator Superfamily protein [Actinacidiphila yanglinensis]
MLTAMGVDAVGSGMYVPFSLVFFHHITGLSFTVVGAVLTAVGLVGMAALPLAGTAVDRYGARRVQLLLYGVRGTGFALYPFATTLPAFAAVALFTAFGDRAFPAVQQSWIGEVAAGVDRDRLQAASRALRNGGLGAGALLASLAISLAGGSGFTIAAWLNAASFGLAALLVRGIRPAGAVNGSATGAGKSASGQAQGGQAQSGRAPGGVAGRSAARGCRGAAQQAASGYRTVLRDRAFLGLTGANLLTALGYSALPVMFPLFIVGRLGLPQALTGAAFTLNTVLCAVGGVAVAGIVRRRGARRTRAAALGAVLFASAFAGLALLGTVRPHAGWVLPVGLFALVVLYTLGETVHSPSSGTLAVAAAPSALRGRYMATYQLSWSLASTLAPSLFTALNAADPRLPWLLLTGTALSAAALLVRLEKRLPADAVRLTSPAPVAASVPSAVLTPAPASSAQAPGPTDREGAPVGTPARTA